MIKKFRVAKKIQSLKHSSKSGKNVSQPINFLHRNIEKNLTTMQNSLGTSTDIKYREFQAHYYQSISVFICFVDGLVNEDVINMHIVKPLLEPNIHSNSAPTEDYYTYIKKRIISTSSLKESNILDDVTEGVLSGETAIFINGFDHVLLVGTQGFEARSVEQPDTESSVRGSREGFNEVLKVNTSLIRRKINNPNLFFEEMKIGKQTKTKIRIGYINGIADSKVVEEVRNRLERIDTDMILESGYLEQYIEDHPYSIFPTVANSEKPDKIAAKLLEGRVAIFCDGTPFVLTVPHLFIETLQVGEDYYSRPYFASLLRLFRVLALLLTIATPSLFVAIATYHQEMVPSLLLVTMAAAEEKVPFPVFIEALMMIIVFELLKEAGVRMPRPVGSAISIVGALVIGEAAVQAGIVSAPMVIVIALTAISGFVVTALTDAVVLSRFFLLFSAASFGFYGILMATLVLLGHMCSLRSFGSPYLAPIAPIILSEWKDALIRLPLWLQKSRPQSVTRKKSKREKSLKNQPNHPQIQKGD
ncbi:spore germination protein [Alkalihalobacillus sp. MEB130]|uniref:spore germination protein n=1 Tax=Alkalihalobacillus sp. MEB130 TaxID=2976704 RepID=UPI0028DF49CF|nr:spore germination protein [Alkalihalobacillus sp. MEB130]MDT8860772.1 spore germination protein [Alkalihalobacillus sp. MEB130]